MFENVRNEPVNGYDSSGLWADTVADMGLISYEVYPLFHP